MSYISRRSGAIRLLGVRGLPELPDPVSCSGMPRTVGLDGLDELLDRQLAVASHHQLLDLVT